MLVHPFWDFGFLIRRFWFLNTDERQLLPCNFLKKIYLFFLLFFFLVKREIARGHLRRSPTQWNSACQGRHRFSPHLVTCQCWERPAVPHRASLWVPRQTLAHHTFGIANWLPVISPLMYMVGFVQTDGIIIAVEGSMIFGMKFNDYICMRLLVQ